MQSSTTSAARFPVAAPEVENTQNQSQRSAAAHPSSDIEMGVIEAQEAPAQADDRELIKHQRSLEHWVKGAVGLGITGMGLWMFKMSVLPNGHSLVEQLGDPIANHDQLKHNLVDASLATTGGLLAMYDGYLSYRRHVAAKKADGVVAQAE